MLYKVIRRWTARSLMFPLVMALALSAVSSMPTGGQAQVGYVTGEVLVKFKPGTSGQAIADAHRQNGGQVAETLSGIDVQVVRVPAGQEAARAAAYARNPNVQFAEVNGFYEAIWTTGTDAPNDPKVSQQWQYDNTGQTGGTPGADINAYGAWKVTTGSSTVAIAILDTGIDQSHEDLKNKIVKNVNFTTSKTVDDKYGHGTHVAGSAAASTDNGIGVAGTCPGCSLFNVKVLGDSGSGSWSGIANGITWAANNGANVISMSLGGSSGSSTVESAVNYAWNKGVVVVAAAGNDGVSTPSYPAYYTNVIAVAATDSKDAKPSWSNYGSWVDVAAPGASILSTAPDHSNRIWTRGVSYGTISGTSMATPHVAGLAGLILSSKCTIGDNVCVRNRVEQRSDLSVPGSGTATEAGSLWRWGRIDALASVGP